MILDILISTAESSCSGLVGQVSVHFVSPALLYLEKKPYVIELIIEGDARTLRESKYHRNPSHYQPK